MAVDIWITFILKLIFVLLAGHIAITKIVPLINDFLLSFIKDKNAVNSFTSLIDIFILVIIGLQIMSLVTEINNGYLNYIVVLQPALDAIKSLFAYLQWILLVLIAVVALKNIKSN